MRNILNNINYKKSLFILVFNLLLITTVSYNINIVFASVRLNPNFDKSYLSRTFYTEKVNEQVDCNQKCKITSHLSNGSRYTKTCYPDDFRCCWGGGGGFGSLIDSYDYHYLTGNSVPKSGAVYYYIHKNCSDSYIGFLAGQCKGGVSSGIVHEYTLQFKDAYCEIDGRGISRSTTEWQKTGVGDQSDAARRAVILCNNDSNVKSAQSTCLIECKRKNDEVRIKLGSTTIEKVKDVLDTLTTEQVFYYLPRGDINSLYDPNMIYQ